MKEVLLKNGGKVLLDLDESPAEGVQFAGFTKEDQGDQIVIIGVPECYLQTGEGRFFWNEQGEYLYSEIPRRPCQGQGCF